MLDKNEIKKALYKEKPLALWVGESKEQDPIHEYKTQLKDQTVLTFKVKQSEMGENRFAVSEPAQLLIRWLVI